MCSLSPLTGRGRVSQSIACGKSPSPDRTGRCFRIARTDRPLSLRSEFVAKRFDQRQSLSAPSADAPDLLVEDGVFLGDRVVRITEVLFVRNVAGPRLP